MMNHRKNCEVSVVLPLFNEEGNINVIYNALQEELSAITSDFEIIFVDDGSTDNSFDKICQIAQRDNRILGISLSRNFGHQIALLAGMEHSCGEYVLTMDVDMQHPPKLIQELYDKATEGYDIVNTERNSPLDEPWLKRMSSKFFYFLIGKLSEVPIHKSSADFRLMNRKTVDAFLKMKEKDRFTRGLVSWLGFKQAFVKFVPEKRFSGKSKYGYKKMIDFAGDGIFSFTSKPLRISFYTGLFVFLVGIGYSIYVIVQYFKGNTIAGWASLMIVVILLGGIQLLSVGIIGEYLARVYNEVKNRPLYYVREYVSKNDSID